MYKKLVFQTKWRLAVSAIPLFLLIGGIVIYGAVERSRHDVERYRWELRDNETRCAEATAKKLLEKDHTKNSRGILLLPEERECERPTEPIGFLDNILKELIAGFFALWIASSVSIFLILTSLSLYIREKVAGWKRLSVVVASGLGLVSFLITLISWSSLDGDGAGFALLFSCAAFPIGVLLVLGGRFTAKWVQAGFSDPAGPTDQPSPELTETSNRSPTKVSMNWIDRPSKAYKMEQNYWTYALVAVLFVLLMGQLGGYLGNQANQGTATPTQSGSPATNAEIRVLTSSQDSEGVTQAQWDQEFINNLESYSRERITQLTKERLAANGQSKCPRRS